MIAYFLNDHYSDNISRSLGQFSFGKALDTHMYLIQGTDMSPFLLDMFIAEFTTFRAISGLETSSLTAYLKKAVF